MDVKKLLVTFLGVISFFLPLSVFAGVLNPVFPDAIQCSDSLFTSTITLYYAASDNPLTTIRYTDATFGNGIFYNPDGTLQNIGTFAGGSCDTLTIANLYATQQAFDFAGGGGAGSFSTTTIYSSSTPEGIIGVDTGLGVLGLFSFISGLTFTLWMWTRFLA